MAATHYINFGTDVAGNAVQCGFENMLGDDAADTQAKFTAEVTRVMCCELHEVDQDECKLPQYRRFKARGSIFSSSSPSKRQVGKRHYTLAKRCRKMRNVTHIIAWLTLGPPPPDPDVEDGVRDQAGHLCHKCRCWNPRHLAWMTRKENDAMSAMYRLVDGDVKYLGPHMDANAIGNIVVNWGFEQRLDPTQDQAAFNGVVGARATVLSAARRGTPHAGSNWRQAWNTSVDRLDRLLALWHVLGK
jgi:hypothetical protein